MLDGRRILFLRRSMSEPYLTVRKGVDSQTKRCSLWAFSHLPGRVCQDGAGLENGRDFGLRDGLTGIAL